MRDERRLFEKHFKPKTGWDFYWSDSINQYMDHQTNAAWFGWQASAKRDGFVLVPVEPSHDTVVSIASVCIGNDFANMDEAKEIYKAIMIEAANENQD